MSDFTTQFAREDSVAVTQYEQGDIVGFVADVGAGSDATADVIDGTAMVVVGDDQYEFDVPAGDATARVNNGVVTVEVAQ
ncbi:MAG: hypothetical protein U5K28_07465 [Halobacteriales archaeon]|nr:hypothetical protein [Halobacteriales archaeon]